MRKKLTEKEEKFCLKYFETGNGTQSVLSSGYKVSYDTARSYSTELLTKPHIKARLQKLRDANEERTHVTVEYILENLQEIVERCMQRSPVMVKRGKGMVQLKDEDGNDVWKFDSNGANQALSMLGKYKKMFTEKTEITGKDGGAIEIRPVQRLSDKELKERAQELLEKQGLLIHESSSD